MLKAGRRAGGRNRSLTVAARISHAARGHGTQRRVPSTSRERKASGRIRLVHGMPRVRPGPPHVLVHTADSTDVRRFGSPTAEAMGHPARLAAVRHERGRRGQCELSMDRPPFNPDLVRLPADERRAATAGPLTVSQLTALVKDAIQSALPATVHVVGEISNLKRHSSGHVYLTLKDSASELACVMWRSSAASLKFEPKDGLEVIATGSVDVFERAGRYQLYIRKLEPRGVGALELAFRQLCEKLGKEGLFDDRHKQPLPTYPLRIVLVTSPTGAAVADMIRTIERRFPCVHLLVYPVRVQGKGAAEEIAAAVHRVNLQADELGGVDVMIVGRGGGSLEDLWAFNEEVVARAIFASRIPVISAVGHEVDVTIADLVADVRAATPTAAAEIAVPLLDDLLDDLIAHQARLTRAIGGLSELLAARLAGLLHRPGFHEPLRMVQRRGQVIDELANRLQHSFVARLRTMRGRLDRLEPVLQRIAPQRFLLRVSVSLRDLEHRLHRSIGTCAAGADRALEAAGARLDRDSPGRRLPQLAEHLDRLAEAVPASMRHRLSLAVERLRRSEDVLAALSYRSVLGRGYSITRTKKGRALVRSVRQLNDGERIVTQLTDGEVESDVVNRRQLELFD